MVSYAGHESCDVPLSVDLESLHCRMELRSGCYVATLSSIGYQIKPLAKIIISRLPLIFHFVCF